MRAISFLFHDVVKKDKPDSSGFWGKEATRYKLEPDAFQRHLEAIAEASTCKPASVFDLLGGIKTPQFPLLLTFDDGGSSAYSCIADILEHFGWYGHFLIIAKYIGSPSFLNKNQIRTLKKRGHVIGTHSCSHPERMSHLSWKELVAEWDSSVKILSDILGEQVIVGSVPAGDYSKRVGIAASHVGLKALFTSEPTTRYHYVDGCLVLGRYAVYNRTSPKTTAQIACQQLSPRLKRFVLWHLNRAGKFVGGKSYLKIRDSLFSRILEW